MKNIDELNQEIVRLIDNDVVVNQQLEALTDYGFEFQDVHKEIKQTEKDYSIQKEVIIDFLEPKFTKHFLTKNKINDIDFIYKNYQITINDIESNDDEYTQEKNQILRTIEELQSQVSMMDSELLAELGDDANPQIAIQRHEESIEILKEQNRIRSERFKQEIEITINANLQNLKADVDKLISSLDELVGQYNKAKGNGNNLRDLIKEFSNHRVKEYAKSRLNLQYKALVTSKKIEVVRKTERIKFLWAEIRSDAWKIFTLKSEINLLVFEKQDLEADYKAMKKDIPIVNEKIEILVEAKFEEMIIDLINQSKETDVKNIKISRRELYAYAFQGYKELLKKHSL